MLVVCNFTDREVPFALPWNYHSAQKLIANYPGDHPMLRPYEAYICYYEDTKE